MPKTLYLLQFSVGKLIRCMLFAKIAMKMVIKSEHSTKHQNWLPWFDKVLLLAALNTRNIRIGYIHGSYFLSVNKVSRKWKQLDSKSVNRFDSNFWHHHRVKKKEILGQKLEPNAECRKMGFLRFLHKIFGTLYLKLILKRHRYTRGNVELCVNKDWLLIFLLEKIEIGLKCWNVECRLLCGLNEDWNCIAHLHSACIDLHLKLEADDNTKIFKFKTLKANCASILNVKTKQKFQMNTLH